MIFLFKFKAFQQTHGNPEDPRDALHGRDAHYGLHLQLPHQEISSSLSLHDNPRGPKDAHHGRGAHYDLPPHLPLQQIF